MKYKYIITALIILSLGLVSLRVMRAQNEPSQDETAAPQDQGAQSDQGAPQDQGAQPDQAPPQDQGAQPGQAAPQGQDAQQDQTPPSVARISFVQGQVSTTTGDAGQWVATTVNAPIQRGDKISTGERSRSEIQLDYADILRLDQQSQANVADLTRSRIQLQLAQGTADFNVLKGSEAEAEIDTPNVAVHPDQEGIYRIQVDPNSGDTIVTVRKGQAEVSTPQGSTTVQEGQMITIQGTDNPQYQVNDAPARDEWDEWNQNRDSQIVHAQSWTHTDKYYTGTQDLDRYGHWNDVPGYGQVWAPDAGSDWAPYQDGRWVWEPYYGWTWVSYEPWGWAPYHYGRWFLYGSSWEWWPGPVNAGYYPMWSPAYVSFFGFGGRGGFGFGFGSIGWCPIGPYDSYYPWYGRGFNNSRMSLNFNFGRNGNYLGGRQFGRGIGPLAAGGRYPRYSNIQAAYNNPRALRGVTSVSARDFGNGSVPRNASHVTASEFRQGQMIRGGVPVAATRQSFSPTGRTVSTPASAGRSETFFNGNRATSGFGRNSSTARTQSFSTRGSTSQPGRFANQPAGGSSARSGWQRFGGSASPRVYTNSDAERGRNGSAQFSNAPRQSAQSGRMAPSSGWQRFGQGSAPAQRSPGNYSAPRSQSAPSQYGRSNSGSGNSYAPRSNYRPPVGMNKPIVTQRAPGGYYGGGRAAPSGGYYGGGRAAPSGGYYGGGRSAPSGGYYGGGRNAAPSRGNYGGGRSAPSSNYGGNRGGSRSSYSGGGSRGGGGGGRSSSGGGHSRH